MRSIGRCCTPRWLLIGAACVCAAASLFSGFLYYGFYWRFRGLFDTHGRYFDEASAVVHHDQASVIIVPVLLFFALTLLFAGLWWFRRRSAFLRAAGGV